MARLLANRPGRRAFANQSAKARPSRRAPRHQGGVDTHSHIRIVPRNNSESAEDAGDYQEDTPTFCSPSLQVSCNSEELSSDAPNITNNPIKTTYASVMRRFNKKDVLEGEEGPSSGPTSLAGLVKSQSNKKKGKGPWRPLQLSDFGEDEYNNDGEGSDQERMTSFTEDFSNQFDLDRHSQNNAPNSGPTRSHFRASPFDLPQSQTNISTSPAPQKILDTSNDIPSGFTKAGSGGISPPNTGDAVVDNYVRIFGKRLPDPIYLSEEIGEFDGQVIFIWHPNRDVSAHQWSADFFRWLNIGLYSHIRRKIEGSLAADRLRGPAMPHNTIEYFKAVAEKRQDSIQAGARFEIDGLSEAPNAPRNEDLRHPTPTDQEQLASHPRNSSSATDRFAIFDRQNSFPSNTAHDATTPSVTVTRQALEDPFVTPVRKSRSNIANQISFTQHNIIGNVGSMDFSYEFPSQGATSTHLSYTADTHPLYTSDTRPLYTSDTRPSYTSENAASQKQIFIQREQERLESMRRGSLPQDHYDSRLADVRFGEETVSGFQVIESPPGLTLPSASISSEDAHDRQKLKNKLIELGASEFRPNKVPGQRNAVPELHTMPAPARNLFPPPGLTVANPNRVVSTLNANAKPYIRTSPYNQAPEEAESETTVVNHQFFTRHSQSQEISNDLGHQAPTPQAFKGPFFTNDMLKTHNPAPSLPFLMDEPAKLQEWFHDGERPARQQEYANSIMATADVDAKARNCQKHGTIGDTTVRDPNRYANTPAFVRLYENLLQYAEESHVGETKDPFARAFKPAPPHLCDLGPNGNDSFFEYGLGSASPQQTRSLNKGQKSSMQQNMSSFGSVDAWPPINAQGGNLGGIFGGPNAKRY